MRVHSLHWLAVLALAACATDKGYEKSRQEEFRLEFAGGNLCDTKDCTVNVMVSGKCVVTIDPPTLGIDRRVEDATIHWKIQPGSTGRIAFTRDGINPKSGNWHREFREPRLVSPTEYTWIDKNKLQGGPFKRPHQYNVDFTQDGVACHFDPTIINDY
jgi:hypothetical protein